MSCKRGPGGGCPAWCREWGRSLRPPDTQGWGHTHDPHAVKGHLGVELGHHVLPPVKGLGVGEVREGGESGPHLDERPEGRQGPWSLHGGPVCPDCRQSRSLTHLTQGWVDCKGRSTGRGPRICTAGSLASLPSGSTPFLLVLGLPWTGRSGVYWVPRPPGRPGNHQEAPGGPEDVEDPKASATICGACF